jgi:hypothetical protein
MTNTAALKGADGIARPKVPSIASFTLVGSAAMSESVDYAFLRITSRCCLFCKVAWLCNGSPVRLQSSRILALLLAFSEDRNTENFWSERNVIATHLHEAVQLSMGGPARYSDHIAPSGSRSLSHKRDI